MTFVEAERLCWPRAGMARQPGIGFRIGPGLSVVRGGEGRGKSALLRLMAGRAEPDSGVIRRLAGSTFMPDPSDPAHDALTGTGWLALQRARMPAWDVARQADWTDAFGLAEHIGKGLFMLSTGSRRKVGLVAAAAGRAELTLLDMPYAALDAPSRGLLSQLLAEAAGDPRRAWVVADYDLPPGLDRERLAALIDLGD